MYKVALSSMWGIGRFNRMADFVSKAKELGFCYFELNHQVNAALLEEFLALYDAGQMLISSVHAPCPNGDADLAGQPQISDLDEDLRRAAVAQVKTTIDLAVRVGARAVVLHVGNVPESMEQERTLRCLYGDRRSSPEYAEALLTFRKVRETYAAAHMAAVIRSLEEIVPYAQERGIILGLENRYYGHEIPSLEEAAFLLGHFGDGVIGYWHDVGHAQTLERLGLFKHKDWLLRFGSRMVGIHLHDAQGLNDHKAVGLGDINLAKVVSYVPAAALRVCEFGSHNTEDQVIFGLERLAQLGYIEPEGDNHC